MLFQIQKELKENKSLSSVIAVETDEKQYKKLKKEYSKLSTVAKQQRLTTETKVYLLLTAVDKEDVVFAGQLIDIQNYEKIGTPSARRGLGRFYALCGWRKKAIEFLLPLFEEEKLEEKDLATLFEELFQSAQHKDCDRILGYALNKYPERIGWKIQALNYQIRISHIYPKNKDFIDNNLNYLKVRCETQSQYFHMGNCFYSSGYDNDAFIMYDLALQGIKPNPVMKVSSALFYPEQCRESMDKIIDILEEINIQVFPVAGSLLGLYRDGKFMDHDKDADVGIFVQNYEEVFNIVSRICSHERFAAPDMVKDPKENNLWNVAVYDEQNNTAVDLFFFYREENHHEFGIYTPCGVLKWGFTPFELIRSTLAGREYWLPDNIEQFLVDMYGDDWRLPVKVWDSLVVCPNILPSSRIAVVYYALMRLYSAIESNKIDKAHHYFELLVNKWEMNFSPEAIINIKQFLDGNAQ